jgi:multiple sugar transport system substrate-binding protein
MIISIGCTEISDPDIKEWSGELTVYDWPLGNDEYSKILLNGKDKFESSHPGTKINFISPSKPPRTIIDLLLELEDLCKNGKCPDLFSLPANQLALFEKNGYTKDLNIHAKLDNTQLSDYFDKSLLARGAINGKQIVIPSNASPPIVIYNKSMLKMHGIIEPTKNWTWEQFADISRKLSVGENGQINKFATNFSLSAPLLSALVLSNGGNFVSSDGSSFKGFLNEKKSVDAIRWYSDLLKGGTINSEFSQSTISDMLTNRVGLYVANYNEVRLIQPEYKEQLGVVTFPKFASAERAINSSFTGYAIAGNSKVPSLAWEFLKYIAIEKNETTQSFLNFDSVLSNSVTSELEKDSYYMMKMDSLKYTKKDIEDLVSFELDRANLNSELKRIILNSIDLQKDLTLLAERLDSQLRPK